MTNIATDHGAIADLFQRLEQTWAAADADGYGTLFTPDCTYTSWAGTAYHGRQDVVRSHRVLWQRFLTGTRVMITCTVVREGDGQCRIAAFHNTKRHRLMEAISFRTEPSLIPAGHQTFSAS